MCDPTIRIAARYVLQHRYFAGYDHKASSLAIANIKTSRMQYDENNNALF